MITPDQIREIVRQELNSSALRAQSPLVSPAEAAILVGVSSAKGFHRWAADHGVRAVRRNAWSRDQILGMLRREVSAARRAS